jgi:3-methyladenine DNA glycosylase AlkD
MNTDALVTYVQDELAVQANARQAVEMAAYMKSEMPFYGVKKPLRVPILRVIKSDFRPASQAEYEAGVRALWALPHREEKYLALEWAKAHKKWIGVASLPLYEELVRDGQWWDFVDLIASHLVGGVYLAERQEAEPWIRAWIEDDDMWMRRTALLSHLRHKEETDATVLFAHCLQCADEKEFFIRKAIGWALREYSKSAPDAVRAFLQEHETRWSGLTLREGSKWLKKQARW